MSIKLLAYIFFGGGLGSLIRYLTSFYVSKFWNVGNFPVGTFLVNILGCFFIGLFSAYFMKIDHSYRFFLITGFCGGFTTFSTFALENWSMWQNQQYITLFSYVFLSIFMGILAVFSGMMCYRNG